MILLKEGTKVQVTRPRHRYRHLIGVIVRSYIMTSGTGLKRLKYTVQYPHSRTKSGTVELAMEADDFEVMV